MSFSGLISSMLRPLLRHWARGSRPQTVGSLSIPGLKQSVEIRWGPYGIPHVFAANEPDLFLAQGYLHAQERLWQMDLNRRFHSGRLAEIFGEHPVPWPELSVHFRDRTIVDLDYFVRLLGIRRTACASLGLLREQYVEQLAAYSEGINRYIETHQRRLPLEFRLLRFEPEPWRPEDSLTITRGFAFFLSTAFFTRLTMSLISEKLRGQDAKLKSLFPIYPAGEPTITRSALDASEGLLRFINGTFQQSDWGGVGGQGSNSWAIAPHRSSSASAILCSDPHLRMTLPAPWYLIHLSAASDRGSPPAFEVSGASVPGSPCVHLGFNRHIAWGVTAAVCDDADIYREKIDPRKPGLYAVGDQWMELQTEEETIRIRGGREARRRLRFSRHGPIISDFVPHDSPSEILALRWTAHEPGEDFRCLYGVNRADNWEAFLHSLSFQIAPTLNYLYADRQGNIGYSLAGRVPVRPQSPTLSFVPGWDNQRDWRGYIPFDELPRLHNPAEGVIATANNKIADSDYPYFLSGLFDPPYRVRRIKELLTKEERFSFDDMAQIQKDTVSVQGRELIRVLRADLEAIAGEGTSLGKVAEFLARWDGDCSENNSGAALYHVFHQRLMANLLTPDLGRELFLAYVEIFNQALAPIDRILQDPRSPWFDRIPRQKIVEQSLREAETELTARLGPKVKEWNWGELHTVTLRHTLDRSKILAPIFSIGPFSSSGDSVTINMGFYRHSNPYHHVVGPSMRMMIDLGNWEGSLFILPSGQSGHPFSPHYGDQTRFWRTGMYIRPFENKHENKLLLTLIPAESHEKKHS